MPQIAKSYLDCSATYLTQQERQTCGYNHGYLDAQRDWNLHKFPPGSGGDDSCPPNHHYSLEYCNGYSEGYAYEWNTLFGQQPQTQPQPQKQGTHVITTIQPLNSSNSGVGRNQEIVGNTPMQDIGHNIPVISHIIGNKSTGVYHNENGIFIPWTTLCNAGQSYLNETCESLINSDGSLTTAGNKAFSCIQTGIAIAAGAHNYLGLSPSVIGSLLRLGASMTGCNGIVDINKVQTTPLINTLLQITGNAPKQK